MDTIPAARGVAESRPRRPIRPGILRPLLARCALSFWNTCDQDLWVNQRLLVMRVLASSPKVDKDTVRSVLSDLVASGVLLMQRPVPKRAVYRLAARFADPTMPGYAREVDELLVDPLPWVTADGQFLRIGRRDAAGPWIHPVATYPHHFTKHAWMRAWVHALRFGLFKRPQDALLPLMEAARQAPADLLGALLREDEGPLGEAAAACRATRLFKGRFPAPVEPDAAVRLLHELCGHQHLAPLLGRPFLAEPRRFLSEVQVYRGIDACVAGRIGNRAPVHMPRGNQGSCGPFTGAGRAEGEIRELEAHVRALAHRVQATLGAHRLARASAASDGIILGRAPG